MIGQMNDNLSISLENSKASSTISNRGKMKITIKLSKEESEAFVNFSRVARPSGVSDDQYYKVIFLKGIGALTKEFEEIVKKYKEEEAKKPDVKELILETVAKRV